jgi:hypothetical protein
LLQTPVGGDLASPLVPTTPVVPERTGPRSPTRR